MRKLILITIIGLLIIGCKEDLYEEQPDNPLKGKIKKFQHINENLVSDYILYYDTSNAQLKSIVLNDSLIYMEIKELNENRLIISFFEYNLLIGLQQDKVNFIKPISPQDTGFYFLQNWMFKYNDDTIDSIYIDAEYCSNGIINLGCFLGGSLTHFNFSTNYLSSRYQYKYNYEVGFGIETEMVQDTFLFEYTNLSNNEPLPYQMPCAPFLTRNAVGNIPIIFFDQIYYFLRLAGYKIFEDNKNLKLSENDTEFKYLFNNRNQVIEMEISYGLSIGQYSPEIITYKFEYYE